ncbi:MAG: class I SAM-dependent methyltransferase [Enhygromyxa sp.]
MTEGSESLLRPVADAGDLLCLAQLGRVTEVLVVGIRLGLFAALRSPKGELELGAAIDCRPAMLGPILRVCAQVGLLREVDGRWQCTPVAARYLAGGELAFDQLVLHVARPEFVADRVIELLRVGECPAPDDSEAHGAKAMAAGARHFSLIVARRLRRAAPRSLLDLGCGPGTLAITLCKHLPQLHALGLDTCAGALRTAAIEAERAGLSDRVRFEQADVREVDLGESRFDLITAANLMHFFDDAQLDAQLERVARALSSGGRLLILDTFAGAGTLAGELTALEWLCWGGPFVRLDAIPEQLRRHGLELGEIIELPGSTMHLVEAVKRC